MPTCDLVLPCRDEAPALRELLPRVPSAFSVIVVDNGSRDDTVDLVRARAASEPRLQVEQLAHNRGKGAAVRRGVELASRQYILFSDADLSTPIEEVDKLAAALVAGADVAIGSRDVADSQIERHQPAYREAMGRTFNGIVRAMARRSANFIGRLGARPTVLFTGGVSHCATFRHYLAQGLGCDVATHPDAQFAGALGAALFGASALSGGKS